MEYKDILIFLDDGDSNTVRIDAVLGLAKLHQANVTGVTLSAIKPENEIVSAVNVLKDMCQQAAVERSRLFMQRAEEEGVTARSHIIHGDESVAVRKLAQYARNYDLVVLRQTNPSRDNSSLVSAVAEQVVLYSGRPVFLMPYIGAHRIPFKKAAIAWDGTPAATRAIHHAIPLLRDLEKVIVLIIEGTGKTARGELLADDLCRHLGNHGINAVIDRRQKADVAVPDIIQNEVVENDLDLLVMGGYGTPNLQQKIFGGVTRTILSSMVVPVLMSH